MSASQRPQIDAPSEPEEFRIAVRALRAAKFRNEVLVEPMPAPQRIAPYSAALSGDVSVDGEDIGSGRLVLLHDPAGNDAWEGTFRCVAYVRADVGDEQAGDSMLAEVAWTWLTEALEEHDADYTAASGTVTSVVSESFGSMAGEPRSAQVEIRASWTPLGPLAPHAEAWGELLCTAVGLPPVPEGVTLLPQRRGMTPP